MGTGRREVTNMAETVDTGIRTERRGFRDGLYAPEVRSDHLPPMELLTGRRVPEPSAERLTSWKTSSPSR